MPTRVFIESTSTFADREVGGIHRVVQKIVEEMRALHEEFDVESTPVVLSGGRLRDARSAVPLFPAATPMAGLLRACGQVAQRLKVSDSILWNDTDLLLLLDASWGKRIWPAVRKAKKSGVTIGVMVHDLIPVHYPQFFPKKLPKMFRQWLEGAVQHADFFLGNSQTTLRDVQQYVQQASVNRPWSSARFDSFSLGADLPNTTSKAPVQEAVRSFFADAAEPYLMVSTLEPRKNHTYLLDAFDRVWKEFPKSKLCLVGKIGWQCDRVLSRIREHPQFGRSLMMFHDLNDADLQFCYRNAKAFVFPSIVEGFGLPIVEALNHGLRVLAGDTPIHREVGREHCRYFDLDDANSLVRILLEMERTARQTDVQRNPYCAVTWEESCRELLGKCLEMAAIRRAARGRRWKTAA